MPITINGATSGSTTITAPATGSDETIELSTALAAKLDIAGGKILQIVRATDSTQRTTTSTSYVDVTGMSVTITPQKSDSIILLISSNFTQALSGDACILAITDNSNNTISGAQYGANYSSSGNQQVITNLFGYATPATTSATTYKLRFRSNSGGSAVIYNELQTGQMYAIEVSA
jgi:hypothetical protein